MKEPRLKNLKPHGKGKRVVVFVHGIDGDGQTARGVADAMFGGEFRVVTYDLIGRGAALGKKTTLDHTLESYVAQLLGVVRKLTAPVYLAGYSMGGAIAAAFADRHPASVARLALICPAGRISPTGFHAASVLPFSIWKSVIPRIMLQKALSAFGNGHEALERKRHMYLDERFLRVLYNTFRQFPLHNLPLASIAVRTLIVAAESDQTVPAATVMSLSESFTDKKTRTFKGTHALPFQKPEVVGRAIKKIFSAK